MKLQNSQKAPKPNGKTLHAYLVSPSNVKLVKTYIAAGYGLDLRIDADYAEKGRTNLYMTEDIKLIFIGTGDFALERPERLRNATHVAVSACNDMKLKRLFLAYLQSSNLDNGPVLTAIAETAVLSNYQFLQYKSEAKENSLKDVKILGGGRKAPQAVEKGRVLAESACVARDLVNEPVITLTATELSKRAEALGKTHGFSVEVFNKSKIKSLKMGGVLAVNYGSPEPPTFTIMEYKPRKPRNSKPVVLVGKGVVFDTGGLSLKPTPQSMDLMKSDMAGAAAVVGTLCGVAALGLDVHVIGLVPATDNRPGQNAVTPGDVIRMFDGTSVEVLNTDAEGRLILGDALAYAKKYDPELVVDLATLTGAAVIAVGTQATALMGTADKAVKESMSESGFYVHERTAELPLWEEYGDLLKSDIADLKNIGGRTAGSITAGKFLEHFTDYPWIHLDIAGPAFLPAADSYRAKNGTGVGVRLLLHFIENHFA